MNKSTADALSMIRSKLGEDEPQAATATKSRSSFEAMDFKALKILDKIRFALIERREEGAPVSPMQGLLDECACQEPQLERKQIMPGTKARRRDGVYVKQQDGRWLKMKAKKGKKDPYAGMSISQINRQRSRENQG